MKIVYLLPTYVVYTSYTYVGCHMCKCFITSYVHYILIDCVTKHFEVLLERIARGKSKEGHIQVP